MKWWMRDALHSVPEPVEHNPRRFRIYNAADGPMSCGRPSARLYLVMPRESGAPFMWTPHLTNAHVMTWEEAVSVCRLLDQANDQAAFPLSKRNTQFTII